MSSPLRVGVVGAGWGGELHLEAYSRCSDAEVVALCSRTQSRAEEVAARFGVPAVYADMGEMLRAQDLDIVSVATPPSSHREFTMAALERGCHVLCDKPIALTAADAEEMFHAAESRGVRHATGFIWRNDPGILRMRAMVAEGAIGRIQDVHCRSAVGAPILPMTWVYDADVGGGALMQHGGHVIDRARWLLQDEIVAVSGELVYDVKETVVGPRFHNIMEAFAWAGRRAAMGGEDLPTAPVTADTGFSFSARFASGVRGQFWESMHGHGLAPDQVELYGTHGTLMWAGARGLMLVRPRKGPEAVPVEGSSEAGSGDMKALAEIGHRLWARLAQAFVNDIRGVEHEPYPNLYDGWKVQQVVDAVRTSTASGRWEEMPTIGVAHARADSLAPTTP